MHVLLCIVTGRYSSRLYIAYAPLVSICITYEAIRDWKQIEECILTFLHFFNGISWFVLKS